MHVILRCQWLFKDREPPVWSSINQVKPVSYKASQLMTIYVNIIMFGNT